VVSRESELGTFPARVADLARAELVRQIGAQMGDAGINALTPMEGPS
jgi:hypothetical protein